MMTYINEGALNTSVKIYIIYILINVDNPTAAWIAWWLVASAYAMIDTEYL